MKRTRVLKTRPLRPKNTPVKKFLTKLWHFSISNVGAFIIGISALLIGLYQYYVNRPIIEYDTFTHSFISSQNNNRFKVLVDGKAYDNLYQTVVLLENNGQQPLAGSDVSKIGHDPIRIIVPQNAEMVHFTIDRTLTTPSVSARLKSYHNSIVITFDFLNPGTQIAVTILHVRSVKGFKVVGSALGINGIHHVLTDRQWLYIAIALMAGIYLLTLILGVLDRKGYL